MLGCFSSWLEEYWTFFIHMTINFGFNVLYAACKECSGSYSLFNKALSNILVSLIMFQLISSLIRISCIFILYAYLR